MGDLLKHTWIGKYGSTPIDREQGTQLHNMCNECYWKEVAIRKDRALIAQAIYESVYEPPLREPSFAPH